MPSLARCCLRFAILAALVSKRRLLGHGQPLTAVSSAAEERSRFLRVSPNFSLSSSFLITNHRGLCIWR
jgi:hypothetical protein